MTAADDMDREAEKWFYDLGKLADVVDANHKRSIRADSIVTVIAAITLTAFLLLAWRTEVNAGNIDDNTVVARKDFVNLCILSRDNAESMNVVIDQVLVQIQALPDTDPNRETYLRIYTAAKPKIPDCGDRRNPT